MTPPPKNVVASILARLRNVAEEAGLSFNDILQAYVIERFLARLARSPHVDSVLLKGALMLRVWGVPRARPTMDIDLLRRGMADQRALVQLVEQCASISDPSDGVIFEPTTISVEPIRDATEYVGTRIRLQARLDNVRQTVQIDFGVGDAVHPEPQIIDYPVLLTGPPVRLNGYPVEAAIAEKFQAMVHLDLQNSRMKDFYDIWILARQFDFDGEILATAIQNTFANRKTVVQSRPTALSSEFGSDASKQMQWKGFLRKTKLVGLPTTLQVVIDDVGSFLLPLAKAIESRSVFAQRWVALGPWRAD